MGQPKILFVPDGLSIVEDVLPFTYEAGISHNYSISIQPSV